MPLLGVSPIMVNSTVSNPQNISNDIKKGQILMGISLALIITLTIRVAFYEIKLAWTVTLTTPMDVGLSSKS
jgi:hypothetical protein